MTQTNTVGDPSAPAAPRAFVQPGIKLVDGVHAIGPSRHGLSQGGYSRAYLFEDGDDLTLVDTLWDEDASMILHYLWSIGRLPTDIKHICVTHAHRSHLGGLATLKALSGATVHSHAAEAPIIEGKRKAAKIPLRPLQPVELILFRVSSQLGFQPHVPCKVDLLVEEDSTVGPLKVLHLPGHTPGNLALLSEKARAVAVADTIMTWPSLCAGWPGFNQDQAEFRRSLKRVIDLEPELVCTGHGDPITENATAVIAPLLS